MSASRILIAATASGVGKTTITCGLLRVLQRRGLWVQACKCGPDFIDLAFHQAVLGVPSRNLDLFLAGEGPVGEGLVRELVSAGARDSDVTVIEGAMGYYDGIAQSADASAYDVARATQTPVVLVVDARGRALSVAAEVAGFARFREPSYVAGVILNHASASYYPQLKAMIERECNVRVMGFVPAVQGARLEHRHLGLVAASEVADLQARVDVLANAVEKTVEVDALLDLAQSAEPIGQWEESPLPSEGDTPHCWATIAVARDEAFSFYYEDSLEVLRRLGAQIVFFSPLRDEGLPDGVSGLYLGGGYPELHACELSENSEMRAQVRAAVTSGMPTIAECGGFLYLHRELEDAEGVAWPMADVLSARAYRAERMGRFGYVTLTARCDGLLAREGESLRAHEFHYWESTNPGSAFRAQKPQSTREWECVVSTPTLYAGFPHLYLAGSPTAAKRFVDACAAYASRRSLRGSIPIAWSDRYPRPEGA